MKTDKTSRLPGKVGGEQQKNPNLGDIPDYIFKNFYGIKLTVSEEVGTWLPFSLDSLILSKEFPAL